jgi:hypothetical protein
MTFKPFILNTVDITAIAKTAESYLTIVLAEIKYAVETLGVRVVGWCTDDSGESRKMRRLLRNHFAWIIVVCCWCHQVRLTDSNSLNISLM